MTSWVRDRAILLLNCAACVAAVSLYSYGIAQAQLRQDHFQILAASATWAQTRHHLWLPHNEHVMPLGRLLTYALIELAGGATHLPALAALLGPAALVVALGLTYRFVQRELGQPFYSLTAMILFGVTGVYQQAVYWFAASFSVLALDALLLGLLAAQSYRRTRRWPFLLLSALWCAVAPCWFASGVLAGPLCALYLLLSVGEGEKGRRGEGEKGQRWSSLPFSLSPLLPFSLSPLLLLVPALGTAAFLAYSLPRNADRIMHLEHYQMQDTDALHAFQPDQGFLISLRSIVENLLLGLFGVTQVQVPVPLVIVAWVGLWEFGRWWWRHAPCKRLLVLGLGLIWANYLLVYSARASWTTDYSLYGVAWSRYHLLPQLGVALFLVGGLPAWNGIRFSLREDGRLTRKQVWFVAGLIGVLWLLNLPRGIAGTIVYDDKEARIIAPAGQQAALRRVEMVDARCREYGVSAETTRRMLPPLAIPGAPESFNGWKLLQGSAGPHTPETRWDEALRRLLEE